MAMAKGTIRIPAQIRPPRQAREMAPRRMRQNRARRATKERRPPFQMASLFSVLERETGFEPATSTLARWHSTAELLPRARRGGLYPATFGLSNLLCSKVMIFF